MTLFLLFNPSWINRSKCDQRIMVDQESSCVKIIRRSEGLPARDLGRSEYA